LFIQRIQNSEFVRHVGTLATGSLLAQVVSLAASPIIARLYDPNSYAVLALFMAIVSTIAPAASGRYEIAIVVAKNDQDSDALVVLSLWFAGGISLVMLLMCVLGEHQLKGLLNADSLGLWWLMVPVMLFLTAAVAVFKYYANRHKRYSLISRMMIAQALFGAVLSICLGVAGFKADGLLVSALFGTLFGVIYLLYIYRKKILDLKWRFSIKVWAIALRYSQFPLYNALPSFLDSLTLSLPIFFLTKHFPEAIVGYYALLTRVATAPVAFISQAISQVHIRKVAEQIRDKQDPTRYLFHLTLLLVGIMALPTLAFMCTGPAVFAWFFGAQWRMAGELLGILMPAVALRFVVSTVSGVFSSTGNNHLSALWKIIAFLLTFLMFWVLADKLMVKNLFIAMMINDLALYSFYYYLVWYAVNHPREF